MKPRVQLRFNCLSKQGENVTLMPKYIPEGQPGHEEMKAFFKYTPSGQLQFNTINENALALFEQGKDYYIFIEAVPEGE